MQSNINDDNNDSRSKNKKTCNINMINNAKFFVFIAALICGTACSICGKIMYGLHGIGIHGKKELFTKPIFQTIAVFVGMTFGLFMHWFVIYFHIPFPGYENRYHSHQNHISPSSAIKKASRTSGNDGYGSISTTTSSSSDGMEESWTTRKVTSSTLDYHHSQQQPSAGKRIPIWMYFFLIIPATFDLAATGFASIALVYVDVSIYQLLRGSGIIYVALMRQWIIGDKLFKYQWVGVLYNVLSVLLVGLTAMLNANQSMSTNTSVSGAILGVVFLLLSAFVQACQYVFEEKVMTGLDDDITVPPLFLIGAEGLWGTILCLIIVYPVVYYLPGNDHGSYEDPFNTWAMLISSRNIQIDTLIYFVAIFGYNVLAVLVTFLLSSIWHSILDNFRPITVWLTNLFVFYVITREEGGGEFGEPWTKYSYIQLVGLIVLLYGTAIYNAPNPGSIKLQGQWYSLGLNFKDEFNTIRLHEWEKEFLLADGSSSNRRKPYKAHSWAEIRSPIWRYSSRLLLEADDSKEETPSLLASSSEKVPLKSPRSLNELVV